MGVALMTFVERMDAPAADSFRIFLREPCGFVLEALGKPSSNVPFIMPKRVAETDAFKQIEDYTGSGPYIFKRDEFKPGDRAVYLKNPNYKPRAEPPSGTAGGKNVYVERVEWNLALRDVQAQANALVKGEIDITKLLAQVKSTMEARLKARGMKLRLELDKNVPKFPGDWDELQEVFDNLVDNAVKYGKAGSKITVSAAYQEAPKGFGEPAVVIAVHNFGEAIPRDQIPRITERFYRVDKSRSRQLGGTGLGLAIVKHIIKHHRGKLEVSSSAGEGTKFSIFLPARKP